MPFTSEKPCSEQPGPRQKSVHVKDGSRLLLRPISPKDEVSLGNFFACLDGETVFFRFLRYWKSPPEEWLHRFSHVDHSRDVAMVALEDPGVGGRIVGECRVSRCGDSTRGEVALVVADAWQGKGVGSALFEHSACTAKELELTCLWALVSSENVKALALARKFGFSVKGDCDADTWELEMELDWCR